MQEQLGFLWEPGWQAWAIEHVHGIVVFLNWAYIVTYWPVILALAIYLFLRNRREYYYYRTVVLLDLIVALAAFALFPVASPFAIPTVELTDTIQAFGPAFYGSESMSNFYNTSAAMPSLHFSWTIILGVYWFRNLPGPFKAAGVVYPVLTLFAIIITGNHFILDAIVGGVLAGLWLRRRRRMAAAHSPAGGPLPFLAPHRMAEGGPRQDAVDGTVLRFRRRFGFGFRRLGAVGAYRGALRADVAEAVGQRLKAVHVVHRQGSRPRRATPPASPASAAGSPASPAAGSATSGGGSSVATVKPRGPAVPAPPCPYRTEIFITMACPRRVRRSPLVVEGLDRLSNSCTSGPVGHGARHLGDGLVDAAIAKLAGDAGEPRGEQGTLRLDGARRTVPRRWCG